MKSCFRQGIDSPPYFDNNPNAKERGANWTSHTGILMKVAEKYGIYDTWNDSDEYMQFRIIETRLNRCKYRLKQSKSSIAFVDSVSFIASITPQHVNGRMYKIENSNGCLWFVVIDILICLIYFFRWKIKYILWNRLRFLDL